MEFGRLNDIVKISKGKKMQTKEKSNLRYIQIEDLRNDDKLKYCQEKSKMVLCQESDILIAWDGANAGTVGYGLEGAIGSTIAKLKIKEDDLHPPFLGKFLQSKFRYLRDRCTGATIPHISKSVLTSLKIPLPSLATQKRIAGILDDAAALRDKTATLLEEYDQLAQSIFLEMFGDPMVNSKGWETKKLSELSKVLMGQSPKGASYNHQGKGKPLLNGPTEFGNKFPTEKQWTTSPKRMSKVGDILFCVRGATAGRMNWSDKQYCIGRGIAAIRSNGNISIEFIYKFLERMYDTFQSKSNGSTFINISSKDLKNISVPVTSANFQTQFAEKIGMIEQQKALAKKELKESEDLFQCLLQRAFRGELV